MSPSDPSDALDLAIDREPRLEQASCASLLPPTLRNATNRRAFTEASNIVAKSSSCSFTAALYEAGNEMPGA